MAMPQPSVARAIWSGYCSRCCKDASAMHKTLPPTLLRVDKMRRRLACLLRSARADAAMPFPGALQLFLMLVWSLSLPVWLNRRALCRDDDLVNMTPWG